MTSGVSVRAAVEVDRAELERLQDRLRDELVDQKGGPALLATAVPLAGGATTTWIGLIGTVPVAFAVAGLAAQHDGTDRVVVETIYVEPEARAVGVGTALMGVVRAWAVEQDAVAIDATVLPGDRASKNFFERHGLVARAITVRSPLR